VAALGKPLRRLDDAREACPGLGGLTPRTIATVHTALAIQRAKHSTSLREQRKNATLLFLRRAAAGE
jgi:hypothetical protein